MSSKKHKAPVIRFKGFTDAWEQRKLMETNTSFTDGNYGESYPSGNDMSDSRNGVPFLRGSNLKNGKLDNSGANYITLEKHKELTSGHLVYDDIVIAVRGSLGALGYVDIDNVDWNINSQLAIIRTDKSELNGAFVIQFLSSNKGQKELLSRQTGTALKQLPIKQLQDVPVPKPELAEQNKISEFFRQLDDTIALHQRQLDNYKELKKTMLQQIFNKELRFKDENGNDYPDWRKTLLKKVAKIYDGTHQTPNYKNKGIKFVSVENIKNLEGTTKYISEEDYKKDFKEVPEFGDILMTRIGDVGTSTVVGTYEPLAYYVSLALIKCKNINSEYLNHYIEGEQFQNELWKKILHVAFPKKINKGDIGECMIIYPSVEEQQKIADFLSAIDKQLEKVEQKVELLKEQKKGLMQQMFI